MTKIREKFLLTTSLCAALAAQAASAADLPASRAVPIEYVKVCSAYGEGYFYIPGTDTCLRLSGRARFEYQYTQSRSRGPYDGDVSGYRGLARFNVDARTSTDLGTLRAFTRLEVANRSGAYFGYGSMARIGFAFPATGVDLSGRMIQYVNVDKTFIQLAGLTAGRASSFFDFYAHDYEMIGFSSGSDVWSTNLLAYTATLSDGLSATLSIEDPSQRFQPIFSNGGVPAITPVFVGYGVDGLPTALTYYDAAQRNRMPDVVGVGRYDAPWGSLQLSAAVHEISGGTYQRLVGINGGQAPTNAAVGRPQSSYGWAVQGGVKVNLPDLAPGDGFYLQGAYGVGAMGYTGFMQPVAYQLVSSVLYSGAAFSNTMADAVVNPFTGRYELSTSWTIVGSFLHYWSPEWRSAVFASYGEASYSKTARYGLGLAGFQVPGLVGTGAAGANAYRFSDVLRDNSLLYAGANLYWSPVRNLDIGVEGVYERAGIVNGRVTDLNKNTGTINGVPLRTTNATDNVLVRMRVQRDF